LSVTAYFFAFDYCWFFSYYYRVRTFKLAENKQRSRTNCLFSRVDQCVFKLLCGTKCKFKLFFPFFPSLYFVVCLSVLLWQLQRVGAFPLFVYDRKLSFFQLKLEKVKKNTEVSEWFIYQFDGRKTDLSRAGIEEVNSFDIYSQH
jgi:hypothetical protein